MFVTHSNTVNILMRKEINVNEQEAHAVEYSILIGPHQLFSERAAV